MADSNVDVPRDYLHAAGGPQALAGEPAEGALAKHFYTRRS